MKYSLIFAATAAAYEAYPAQSSSTPIGYTTVVPGYGKQPVTVTTQHQAYPTCVSAGYGDKTCDKWAEDMYVSTVIKDADKKDCTVTKTKQPVTVYHTKKTITHSATGVYNGYASSTAGYAHPTGYPAKNETGCWYELYEKIETAEYKDLGPHALPGYPGSGLCKDSEKEQKVHVKEYKGGKWSEYDQVHSYGVPEPEITHFPKPGVYEIPAKDVTVEYPVTKEGAVYAPGVYHQDATTITVTKTNEAYTCQYKQTKVYSHGTPTGKYPTQPTGAHEDYGYTKPSATPNKPTEDETSYPQYPVKGNGTHGHDSYPSATPVYSKPSYNGEYPNGPAKASSTPCSEDKLKPTPSASKPAEYNNYPVATPEVSSKAPEYPAYPVETPKVSSKVQEYPSYPQETPSHEQSYPAVPAKASSTPCSDEVKKPTPTASKPAEEYPAYPVKTPEVSSKAPEYPAYPAETPKVSSKAPEYGNGYGAQPEPTKAAGGYKRASFIERRRA